MTACLLNFISSLENLPRDDGTTPEGKAFQARGYSCVTEYGAPK